MRVHEIINSTTKLKAEAIGQLISDRWRVGGGSAGSDWSEAALSAAADLLLTNSDNKPEAGGAT